MSYKNPIFNRNVIDPTNNKIVKSIWWHHTSKLDRNIRSMVWEHYRHRNRKSVAEIYNEYRQHKIEIIYSNESQSVFIDMTVNPLSDDLLVKIKNHLQFVKNQENIERLTKKISKQKKIVESLHSNELKLKSLTEQQSKHESTEESIEVSTEETKHNASADS